MRVSAVVAVLTASMLICCSKAKDPVALVKSDYINFESMGEDSGRLRTAIVTFKDDEGCRVDLIAAVHIADPLYYMYLKKRFETYDALLYELIAEDGAVPNGRRDKENDSIISFFQRSMCEAMNLTFQLDAIDYTKENFVHADLTPTEFAQIWKKKGESIWRILFRFMMAHMKASSDGRQGGMTPEALSQAFLSKDRASSLKLLLAKELENIESLLAGLESGKEGEESVILGERNKACIRVLKELLKDKKNKRMAIFYGGAHMPDMEKRLQKELYFKKTAQQWICAWNIISGK